MRGVHPPGPRGVPILGSLLAVRRDPTGVFLDAALRFGDVVSFKIGPRRGYLISNPHDVRHVLLDNARNYHKSPLYQKLRMFLLGDGLLTSEGEFWLRQRRIAQPAFHRQKVAGLASVMARAARDTAAGWEAIASAGRPVDVDAEMMRLTRTVVLRALLGGDLGPYTEQIDAAWIVINEHIGERFWSLGPDWLPTAKRRRFEAARAVLVGAVDHVIGQRRRGSAEKGDLLEMLLSARDEETGQAMTDDQLRVEVTTFLLAGQETTSLTLTWIWYLLSQHPDAQRRLEAEIDTVLAGRLPEYADLVNLPYTLMVVDEAMRLYPPAWGFSRQAMADDEVGGFHVPRGWLVFVIPWVLHRLPALWDSPERFEPERFSPERSADRPKFAYLPFGAGPRQCIGNQFALIETQLTLATLAQRYRLRLVPGHRVEPWPLITLRPRFGMPMTIERRAQGQGG
ncbi:MAG TPA: cytochrome P450 [Vicinamibacterales bacterium]|nr:cytochrome P450 [Vicinamibacterales bacterium]